MRILNCRWDGYLGPIIAERINALLHPDKLDALDAGWFTEAALAEYKSHFSHIREQDKRYIDEKLLKNI